MGRVSVLGPSGSGKSTLDKTLAERLGVVFVVAVVLAVGALAAAAGEGVARVDEQATRLDPPHRALLISDSAWLGIKTYGAIDGVRGFDHMLDLASCRRRVAPSCRNYDGHVPIPLYDEVEWRGGTFDTLVVATGYNDSDHNFVDDVDAIVGLARANGYLRVVWVTLRSNVSYVSPENTGFTQVFINNNAALADIVADGRHPELVMADWASYAGEQTAWFAGDGIHLRGAGPWAAADYVSRKIAHLDGRACPMPTQPGVAIEDPCPDPDATGAVVDLYGIYPVGQTNGTGGFQMEWEGHGSWPTPPWW